MSQNEILLLTFVVIGAALIWRIRKMTREQRFGIITMWLLPVIFLVIAGAIMVGERVTTSVDIALAVAALAAGGGIGWYQGTHTTVRIDRTARAMFVKVSPIGIAIFIGVLVMRMVVRTMYGGTTPSTLANGGTASLVSVLLLMLVVGMVLGLRAYLARVYTRQPTPHSNLAS
jgi:K+-transporting ATPase A subunit